METISQINYKDVKIELSNSIRDSMEEFFLKLPSSHSIYFTLTFANIFRYHCKQCVEDYYTYGKPNRHWHNVSYSYVNNFARKFSEFFPNTHRLIVVEGNKSYANKDLVSNELMSYLKNPGSKKGDSNYKNISSGLRPHVHGVVHGYDKAQFEKLLHVSKYIRPTINLTPVQDCDCACCINWDNHEHIRTLDKQTYFDETLNKNITDFMPVMKTTNKQISCHLYSPKPQGFYKPILVEHGGDTDRIMTYLYKYLFKDLQTYQHQKNIKISSYLHQESIDSHLQIY